MKMMSEMPLSFPDEVSAVAPESEIGRDLALKTLLAAPLMLAVGALFWGLDGIWSSGLALLLVAVNFLLAAAAITVGARLGPSTLLAAVLGGFVLRLAILTAAVLPVRNSDWFEIAPFAVSLLVTHIGLLAAETRQISATLAYPGMKPRRRSGRSGLRLRARPVAENPT